MNTLGGRIQGRKEFICLVLGLTGQGIHNG